MTDGTTLSIEEIEIGDLTRGGIVTAVMQFMTPWPIFDYRGVTVSGSHAVFEDGKWKRVVDADESNLLSEEKMRTINRVYAFDSTEHRIHIQGILFADYSEVSEDSHASDLQMDALLAGLEEQDRTKYGAPSRSAS